MLTHCSRMLGAIMCSSFLFTHSFNCQRDCAIVPEHYNQLPDRYDSGAEDDALPSCRTYCNGACDYTRDAGRAVIHCLPAEMCTE